MLRKIIISFGFALIALAPALAVDASDKETPPELISGTLLPGVDQKDEIQLDAATWLQNTFIKNIIDQAIGWTAALAVLFLIIGGYQYLTAIGNEEQIKSAHKTVTFALVGLLVALLAYAIIQIIVNIQFGEQSGGGGGASFSSTNYDAIQNDWSGDGGINDEIDAGEKNDFTDGVNKATSFDAAYLLGADVAEILPFAEKGWNEVEAIGNLPKADFKEEFIPIISRFLIYGMAFAGFIVFLFAGVWLVVGWGEEADVKKAKDAIVWAITGLAVAAVSYALVRGLLGIDLSW
ncbi:MAG: hypothetical protein K9L85_01325 [Candidatus Peribacteraceae bacterium]|nr:hypothetical protein [Candidatus Peribacteraceae bacterium]